MNARENGKIKTNSVRLDQSIAYTSGADSGRFNEEIKSFLSTDGKCFLNNNVTLRRYSNTNNIEVSSAGPGNTLGDVVILLPSDIRDLYDFLTRWLDVHKQLAKKKAEVRLAERTLEAQIAEESNKEEQQVAEVLGEEEVQVASLDKKKAPSTKRKNG